MNNPFRLSSRLGLGLSRLAASAGLGALLCAPAPASASPVQASSVVESPQTPASPGRQGIFKGEAASRDARQIADWVVLTRDNQGMPFIIVDKKATKVFMFDGEAKLLGATTALLGLAQGDESAPGVGERKLSDIPPEQRTTPAGRFVASLGLNLANQDILWVDYDTALALHRVLGAGTRQHRLERSAAKSPLDRRITFGCINVPVSFYEQVVRPAFLGTAGVVYILPEIKSLQDVFFRSSSSRAAL